MMYSKIGKALEDTIQFQKETDREYLGYFCRAIMDFINNESVQNADAVYELFLGMYRQKDSEGNPLADLIDVMHRYETRASVFTEKQRDHYVHSVNVFLMGLYLYETNGTVREAFAITNGRGTFDSIEEAFLFTWGNAALFHDIGYPAEISVNQMKAFMRSVADSDGGSSKTKVKVDVVPREDILTIDLDAWKNGPDKSLSIENQLALGVTRRIKREQELVKDIVIGHYERMHEQLFMDHGFFGAVIMLKSYAASMQAASLPRDRFDTEITDAASAILLHNLYPHVLSKIESLGKLKISEYPIGFLLMLCDMLQEWNRKGYGTKSRSSVTPKTSGMLSEDGMFRLNYRTVDKRMEESFGDEKEKEIRRCLELDDVFPSGIFITCSCDNTVDVFLESLNDGRYESHPRPLLENIVEIAKGIHADYNRNRLEEHPDKPLEYPTWESLTQDLQYSNMRQAMCIVDKLQAIGCHISSNPTGKVNEFTRDEIEAMSMIEHDRWWDERSNNGWVYGPKKDVKNRISPYMVPWEELSDEIREYDRQAVRNMIPILEGIGLFVVRDRWKPTI